MAQSSVTVLDLIELMKTWTFILKEITSKFMCSKLQY